MEGGVLWWELLPLNRISIQARDEGKDGPVVIVLLTFPPSICSYAPFKCLWLVLKLSFLEYTGTVSFKYFFWAVFTLRSYKSFTCGKVNKRWILYLNYTLRCNCIQVILWNLACSFRIMLVIDMKQDYFSPCFCGVFSRFSCLVKNWTSSAQS